MGIYKRAKASAPGKAILFGEHAVVHGVTAIAVSLDDLRIFVEIETAPRKFASNVLHITFNDFSIDTSEHSKPVQVQLDLTDIVGLFPQCHDAGNRNPFKMPKVTPEYSSLLTQRFSGHDATSQGTVSVVFMISHLLPELVWNDNNAFENVDINITIKSQKLPIGAGLGSSAAFSVAVVGACFYLRAQLGLALDIEDITVNLESLQLNNPTKDKITPSSKLLTLINNWSYASETLIHGNPSGLDNTTSCFGGVVKFSKKTGEFQNIAKIPELNILLTNTKVPRSTKVLVAGVGELKNAYPEVIQPIFDSIEQITQKFLRLIEEVNSGIMDHKTFIQKLSPLFEVNHYLLDAIGVGHPALTAVCEASKAIGYSCKLTGAGGGGCAITLIKNGLHPDPQQKLLQKFKEKPISVYFDVFQSAIAKDGVLWHTDN